MAGQPQLREAAWLYGDDPDIPLALVRLEERADGSGWLVLLNSPAAAPTRRWERPDEAGARAVLESIYAEGRPHGQWQVHRHDGY